MKGCKGKTSEIGRKVHTGKTLRKGQLNNKNKLMSQIAFSLAK